MTTEAVCVVCGKPARYLVKMPGEEARAFCERCTDWRPCDGLKKAGQP